MADKQFNQYLLQFQLMQIIKVIKKMVVIIKNLSYLIVEKPYLDFLALMV
jgi:hypothetical protein